MDVPYDNFQQNYGYDARHYDAEMAGNGSFGNNGEPHAPGTGMEYGRDRRDVEYNRGPGGGRGNDYGYDSRGMGDRGGGNPSYQREGSREYDRFSDGYDDSASNSSRDRDRERDRDRSRRDRDRRDRHRPRDRDHERSRERRERRDRDRSPSGRYDDYGGDGTEDSQSYRDRERDGREAREDRGGEKWMTDTPTNTILLRGLPSQVDEKDIRAELMMFGAPVKDVRLMRRSTGASRGFAFVEFQNVTDAQRWMDQKQGLLNMLNQYSVTMHYSTPRVGPEKFVQHKTDWTCSKCGVHNFKRRDYCFKCNISREESDKTKDGDGFDQVGTNPCNTLIFRGLDALTTEESLDAALRLQTNLQSKNVRIIRDPVTNTSRGYGFCEMNSIQESTQVLDYLSLNNVPLEVDGKQVLVAYAKNTFSTVMATLNSSSQQGWDYATQQAAVQQGSDFYSQQQYYLASGTSSAASAIGEYDPATGQYYNQATGQYYDGQNYDYSQYYAQQGAGLQTDTTNAAAAVAQAAIAQANAAKNYNRQNSGPKKSEAPPEQATTTTVDGRDYPVYPPPDVSTYQFDKSSGYYYDASTGLYYDANSQFDCPVKDCDVSVVWHKLREHWLNVHEATKTCFTCPLPSCQFKSNKKSTGKYNSRVNFLYHLNKCHGKFGSQCDIIVNMAKMETKENPNYIDPGLLLCPQPKQVAEPPKQIEKVEVAENTAVKQKGKSIASLSKTNLSLHQKKKIRKAEQSALVVVKTSSNETQEPKREPSWIFGTSKKKKKKKKNTETLEPKSLPEPKKKLPQLPQVKISLSSLQERKKVEIIQQKKMAAELRAELIAQESSVPVPELYDPTPTKAKKELTRPLLKLKLKVSATTIKEKKILKINCPVPNCSDAYEAKYSEKLKHYYMVHVQNHFQCPDCKSNFGYPDFNVHMKTEHDYTDEKLGALENVAVTNENFIDPGSHVSYFFEPEAVEEDSETPTGDGESNKEETVDDKTSNSNVSGTEEVRSISDNQDVVEKSNVSQNSTISIAEPSADEKGDQCVDVALSSADYAGGRGSAGMERIIRSREGVALKDEVNSARKGRIMFSTSISKESAKAESEPSCLTKGKSVKSKAIDERYRYYPFRCPVPQCHIILNSGADRNDHFEKFHNKYYYRCSFCGRLFQKNLFRPHLKKDHKLNFHIVNIQLQGYKTPNPFYIDPGCFLEFFVTGVIGGVRPKQISSNSEGTSSLKGEFIKSSTASTSNVEVKSDTEKIEIDSTNCPDTQTEDKPSSSDDKSKHIASEDSTTSYCKRVASVSEPSLLLTQTSESSDPLGVNEHTSQNETTKDLNEKDSIYPMKCPVPQCSVNLGSRMQRVDHFEISHYKFLFQCHLCHKTFQRRLFRPHLKHDHFLNVGKEAARVVRISNPHYVDPGCFEDFFEKGILKEVDKQKYLASCGSADSKNTASTSSVQGKSNLEKTDVVEQKDNDSITCCDTLTKKKSLSEDESSSKESSIEVDKPCCGEDSASVSLPSLLSPQTSVISEPSGVKEKSSQKETQEQPVDPNGEDVALSSADYAGGGSSVGKDRIMSSTSISKDIAKTKTKLASLTKGKSVKTEAVGERYRYYPFKCPVSQCHIILNSGADRVDHFEKFHNKYYYKCGFCGLFFQKNLYRPHLKKDHMVNLRLANIQLLEYKTPNPFYIDPGCFQDFFVKGVIGGVRPKQISSNSEGTTSGKGEEMKSSTASTSSVEAKSDTEKIDINSTDCSDRQTEDNPSLSVDKSKHTAIEDGTTSSCKGVASVNQPCFPSTQRCESADPSGVNEDTPQNESVKCLNEKDSIYPLKCPVPCCLINLRSDKQRVDHYEISHFEYLFQCHVCHKNFQRRLLRAHLKKEHHLNFSGEALEEVQIPNPHYVDPGLFEDFLEKRILKEVDKQKYLASCGSADSKSTASTSSVTSKSDPEKTDAVEKKDKDSTTGSESSIKENIIEVYSPNSGEETASVDQKSNIYPIKCPVPRCLINLRSDKQRIDHFEISHYKFLSQCHLCHKNFQRKLFRPHLKNDHNLDPTQEVVRENQIPNPHYVDPGLFQDFLEKNILKAVDKQKYLASCESNKIKIYPMKCPVPRCLINLRSDKQRVDHFEISHFKYLYQCHFCHKNFQRKLFRPHLKNDHNLDPNSVSENEVKIPNPHYVDPGLFEKFLEKGILKDIDKQMYLASCNSAGSDTTTSASSVQNKFDKTHSSEKKDNDSTTGSESQTVEKILPGVERSMKDTAMEGSRGRYSEDDMSVIKSNIYPIKCPVPQCFINLRSDEQRVNHYEISHFKFLFLCHLCHKSFQRRLFRPHLENDHKLDTKSMSENEVKIPNPHYVDPGLFEEFLEKGILKDVDKQMYLASCGSVESNTTASSSSVHNKSGNEKTDSLEKKEVNDITCFDLQAEEKTLPEEIFIEKSTTMDALLLEGNAKSPTVADEDKPVEENLTGPKNHNTKPNGMEEPSSEPNVVTVEDSPPAIEEVENANERTSTEFVSMCTQNKPERETGEDNFAAETLASVGSETKLMAEKDNSITSESKTKAGIEVSTEDTSLEVPAPLSDEVKRIAVSEQNTLTGVTSKVGSTVTIQTAADAPPRLQSFMSTAENRNTDGPHLAASKTVASNKSATIPSPIATICKGKSHAQVDLKKYAITSVTEGSKNKNSKPPGSIDCLKSIATVHSVRPNLLTIKTVDDYTPAAKMSFSSPTIMAGKTARNIASVGNESTKNVQTSAPPENAEGMLDRNSEKSFTKQTISDVATTTSVEKNEKSVSEEGVSPTKNTDTESAGKRVGGKGSLSGVTTKEEKNSVTSIEVEEHSITEDVKIMEKGLKKVSPKSITTAHSVRPNLLAIKTVEDFGMTASSSVPSATNTTKRKAESTASFPKRSSVKDSVKGQNTNEKMKPPVNEKNQFIYPLKCPVPECQFEIKSCTERADHFEKIHYKYYFGCKICGGIFQKKLFRPHQKKDHFLNKIGTLDEAKIPNPYYVNPGTFLHFFTMGDMKGVDYKPRQHNPPVIKSMSNEEATSSSQKTVSGQGRKQNAKALTKDTSKDELKRSTKETKYIKAESRGSRPESRRRKLQSREKQSDTTGSKSELKQRKPESLITEHKSTRSKHETTRKKPESRRKKPNSTETKQDSFGRKPKSNESRTDTTKNKHESTGTKSESTGIKPESTGTKPESTGTKLKSSKPETTGTKPESTGTKLKSSKPESTGTKLKSSKPESTGTKLKSSKPESTGTKLKSSKPESTGSKPESTGTQLKSSKPESTGTQLKSSKPELTGSKTESTGSRPESSGTQLKSSKPESTGIKPESTGTKHESTGTKHESTRTKHESTGTKPESTGSKPESTGNKLKSSKPESTGSKPESTGSKHKSTGTKPESKKNTTDSKGSILEEGASKPETTRSTDVTKGSKSELKGNKRDSREGKHDSKTNADNSKKRTVHSSNRSKSRSMHRDKPVSDNRKRKIEKEPIEKSKHSKRDNSRERNDSKRERTKHSTESRTSSRRDRHELSKSQKDKPATLDDRKRKTDKSYESAKRLRRDRSREERKGSKHDLKPKTGLIENRHDNKTSKTESKGSRRELIQAKTDGERRNSKDEKSEEKSNTESTNEESKKLTWIEPKVIYASEPCREMPTVSTTEVDLMWFLTWTDEYIVKLEEAQRAAERQLKDMNP